MTAEQKNHLKFLTNWPTRKLEWSIAVYTIMFGLWLMLPMTAMSPGSFRRVLGVMSEGWWGLSYAAAGVWHVTALHINGRAAWTPFARLCALVINSQVFLAMAIHLAKTNPFGTGAFTYGFIAIGFCGPAIAAAAYDCGKEYKIWRGRKDGGI